jgi:ABC-type uncharacterized transport system ATPase subunit
MDLHIYDATNIHDHGDQAPIVILATHLIEDISELCTQMAAINRGEDQLRRVTEARTLARKMDKAECRHEPAIHS